ILTREQQNLSWPEASGLDIFVAIADSQASDQAFKILASLRQAGWAAEKDYLNRSLKAQMKYAGKLNPRFTLIVGSSELAKGTVVLKNMVTGEQQEISLDAVISFLNKFGR
ncbi:MAG: His/Gly/Thr/Pro-type tRNA ligase C-terminal domain-containing protein, partial [Clostridia bacterium]|nr:His/Gly/Thr/Pro-type tRNA ligase C-terminal domain-containing protein [Clostridia bacterium]